MSDINKFSIQFLGGRFSINLKRISVMLRVTNDKRLFCPSQSSPTTSSTDVKNTPNLLMSNTQNPVTNVPIRLISKSSGDKKRELQLRQAELFM